MTLIDRYLFWQVLKWTMAFALIVVHAIVFAGLAVVASRVVEQNLPWSTVWAAYLGLLPNAAYLSLPICTALAVLWVYGQLWNSRALPVLYGSGYSSIRLAMPGLLVATLATVGGAMIGHFLAPAGARALEDAKHILRHGGNANHLWPGRFNYLAQDKVVFFFKQRSPTGAMSHPLLHDRRDHANPITLTARQAIARTANGSRMLEFRDGVLHQGQTPKNLKIIGFKRVVVKLDRKMIPKRVGRPPYELTTSVLLSPPANWVDDLRMVNDARSELQKRLVIPPLALVLSLFVLGALLFFLPGSQRPGLRQAMIGILVILGNFGIVIMVDTGARYSYAVIAMAYVSCGLVAGLGAWFLWATHLRRRTRLLNVDRLLRAEPDS